MKRTGPRFYFSELGPHFGARSIGVRSRPEIVEIVEIVEIIVIVEIVENVPKSTSHVRGSARRLQLKPVLQRI